MSVYFENKKVEVARTRILGHFHSIEIQLCFDDCTISINPKREWFARHNDGSDCMPFFNLLECFDLDGENGANVEDISGRYCRLMVDSFKPIAIYHITKDKFVLIEDLK